MPTDLVIFDCDGVLVETEARMNDLMAAHFTSLGLPMTGAECRTRFQGHSLRDLCTTHPDLVQLGLDPEALRNQMYDGLATNIEAIPGVETLVETLIARKTPVCVASSGAMRKMHMTLGQTRLLPLLKDVLYSADSVARSKPHPDIFEHAAKQMGVDIHQSVVIEDSITGVTAGVAAGARVLGYCGDPFTDAKAMRAAGAETFDHMDEVLDRL